MVRVTRHLCILLSGRFTGELLAISVSHDGAQALNSGRTLHIEATPSGTPSSQRLDRLGHTQSVALFCSLMQATSSVHASVIVLPGASAVCLCLLL